MTHPIRTRVLARVVLAAGVVALGVSARADQVVTITQSHDLGTLQTQVPQMNTASFNKFDPTLGTLQSVTISLANVGMSSNIFATYAGNGTATMTVDVAGAATLQVPASLLPAGDSEVISPGFSLSFSQQLSAISPDLDVVRTLGQSPSTPLSLTLTGSAVQGFEGPGTFSLLFSASATATISNNNGNGTRGVLTYVTGTPTVVYSYVPLAVPEPAGLVLVALGGVGIAAGRRVGRRRARSGGAA